MTSKKICPYFIFIFIVLTTCPFCFGTPAQYQAGDEDVLILNDRFPSNPMIDLSNMVTGDFNGDGRTDVAILLISQETQSWEVNLFLGGTFSQGSTFSNRANLRVLVPGNLVNRWAIALADVNSDGKKDLIIGNWLTPTDSKGLVSVIFSKDISSETIDLASQDPDVKIIGETSSYIGYAFAQGDFNGDGREDLLLGGLTYSYFLFGSTAIVSGSTLDFSINRPPRFKVTLRENSIAMSGIDLDHDGKTDLIIPRDQIHVIFGRDVFNSTWTIGSPPADIQVGVGTGYYSNGPIGDLNGDGKPEMLVDFGFLVQGEATDGWLLDGNDLLSGASVVNSNGVRIPFGQTKVFQSAMGDFDGDGKNDFIFMRGTSINHLSATLSSGLSGGAIDANALQTPTFTWNRPFETLRLADLNGDGLMDILAYDNFGSLSPYGAIRVMYGYRLLLNPHVSMDPPHPTSPHVNLALDVEGDPAEVMISGDIIDSSKDQWIPYTKKRDVTLSPFEGEKKVHVRFRNAFKRESEVAELSTSMAVDTLKITVRTNRIKKGGRAEVDCHLIESGNIKASVFNRLGEKVIDLMDEHRGPGVWTVGWDGQNRDGKSVVPGFYVLVIDSAGQKSKITLLVQQ